jgi:hypothetical protein
MKEGDGGREGNRRRERLGGVELENGKRGEGGENAHVRMHV